MLVKRKDASLVQPRQNTGNKNYLQNIKQYGKLK